MDLLRNMDCQACSVTYMAAVKACGGMVKAERQQFSLEKGFQIHKLLKERGFESETIVASTLVDMYSKCGRMDFAREVFESMPSKGVAAWNSLILGYVKNGASSLAMAILDRMDCTPNYGTFVAALKACGNLAALPAGLQIHGQLLKFGFEKDPAVANTLIDMYGKCGSMARAEELFNNLQFADTVMWNKLIAGHSFTGDASVVFSQVNKMHRSGLKMDSFTFVYVLTACSHAGLVEKGKLYFKFMVDYGVDPDLRHYTCMVDMLGRANRLDEALALVKGMPMDPDAVTWKALLGACKKWNNVEAGRVAFDAVVALDREDEAAYDMMREIYASLNMWDDMKRLERKAQNDMTRLKRKAQNEGDMFQNELRTAWWCDGDGRIVKFVMGNDIEKEALQKLWQVYESYL